MSAAPPAVRRYAQRRLSPFLGTVQVVEVDDGRALSYDGREWEIQLRAQQDIAAPLWGNIGTPRTARPFFRYGRWLGDGELRRLPLNPLLGDVSAYPALAALMAALREQPALPFALQDRFECWVLDRAGAPALLFASACAETARELPQHPRWQAAGAGMPDFHSAALAAAGVAGAKPHALWLADALSREVGTPLSLQWFHREDDAGGSALDGRHLHPDWQARRLPAAAFPRLPVREVWDDALITAVVREYLAWQAPYLLLLDGLGDGLRAELEIAACARPQLLTGVRRLLPRICDRALIDAALVRARLEAAAGGGEGEAGAAGG